MMLRQFRKLPAAVVLALMAAAATLIMAHAQEPTPAAPTQPEPQTPPCVACHTEFASEWKDGPHGQASTDPVFLNEWNSQGQPGACLVCHATNYDPATGTWLEDGVHKLRSVDCSSRMVGVAATTSSSCCCRPS